MALYLRDTQLRELPSSSDLVTHPVSPGYSPHSPAYINPFFGGVTGGGTEPCTPATLGPANFTFHGIRPGLNALSLCQPIPRVRTQCCLQTFHPKLRCLAQEFPTINYKVNFLKFHSITINKLSGHARMV